MAVILSPLRPIPLIALGVVIFVGLGCSTATRTYEENKPQRTIFPPASTFLPVLQGLTSESAALINVIAETNDEIHLTLASNDPEARIEWRELTWPGATEKVIRARASGLRVGLNYQLLIYRNRQLVDRREFAALNTQQEQFRVLIGSCMYDGEKPQEMESIWARALERKPDVLFLIGDNAYADLVDGKYLAPADGAQLWRRYAETMVRLPLYRWKRLVPVLATWDDHDFGVNDGDRNHPYKEQARQVFLSYFPQEQGFSDNWTAGPGVASRWNAFGFVFHFLDARSFRSPRVEAAEQPAAQTQFGTEQETWILSGLEKRKLNFLIKGDQWWGAYHRFESYEGSHPRSFMAWLARLRRSAAPTIMISGDRHMSEVMRIPNDVLGYETYEFTVSPIHARKYSGDWDKTPNPRQLHGMALQNNWLEIEAMPSSQKHESSPPPKTTKRIKSRIITEPYSTQITARFWSDKSELYSISIEPNRILDSIRATPSDPPKRSSFQ